MPKAIDELIRIRSRLQQLCRSTVQHMLWEDPVRASQPFWDAMLLDPERPAADAAHVDAGEPHRALTVFSAKPCLERRASRSRSL